VRDTAANFTTLLLSERQSKLVIRIRGPMKNAARPAYYVTATNR